MPEDNKEERQNLAYLVRTWEAACKIEHPTPDEQNFRVALAKKLGAIWGLRELRDKVITGPVAANRPAR